MKRVLSAILILAAIVTAGLVLTGARAQDSYWVQLRPTPPCAKPRTMPAPMRRNCPR
ncbi:MAG: hypothetical protein R3D59_13315 [Paracoccaceae bacterium]